MAAIVVAAVLLTRRGDAVQVSVGGGRATVGAAAPDFTTQDLNGRVVRLSALRGKPVILDFWATWCTACQDEMPAIQQATDRYGQGLTVVAANYRETDRTAMRRFLDHLGVKFEAVVDPDARIADAYGVNLGLPVSIFLNRAGTIEAIQLGAITPAQLAADIQKAIA